MFMINECIGGMVFVQTSHRELIHPDSFQGQTVDWKQIEDMTSMEDDITSACFKFT